MKAITRLVPLVLLGFTLGLHAAQAPATAPASAPATQAAKLLPIRYQRTGGFAGTNDVIEITPEGVVAVQGRLMGNSRGQLTPEQIAKLVPLFADWKSYKASYPAPAGSADGFEIRIRYGTSEVAASDLNETLPESFKAVQKAIEQIAADLKK